MVACIVKRIIKRITIYVFKYNLTPVSDIGLTYNRYDGTCGCIGKPSLISALCIIDSLAAEYTTHVQ